MCVCVMLCLFTGYMLCFFFAAAAAQHTQVIHFLAKKVIYARVWHLL
jgi:hypothetical protein